MNFPLDFPPGSRLWQMTIDHAVDVTTGQFMLLDGSTVSGRRAERLRDRITHEGVEISEADFRQMAPQSLAERTKAIAERAKRNPEYAKALSAALAKEEGLLEECESVARDAMQNAPDREERREGVKLLLKILAKKQNITDQ